jgi:alpha-beta hydrolase superfamily lysophospholipase
MVPFAAAVTAVGRGKIAVASIRYAVRGWNGADQSPLADTRLALEQIEAKYPGVPIGLLGHSMGGRVALHLADDERINAIVALAPWVEPRDRPRSHPGLSVLFMHGSQDRMTSPSASLTMANAMARLGTDVSYESVKGDSHAMLRQASRWHREAATFLVGHLLDQPCRTSAP